MKIIDGVQEMKAFAGEARDRGETLILVPTMGYLHDGHVKLIETGKNLGSLLILSIFVNPAQFGPKEDFAAYPRDLKRDLKMADTSGVDVVFTPKASEMYPGGFTTYVTVEGRSEVLCGITRPGHFRGVATVVLKLFNIAMPHRAVFGKKDFQQLVIIKRMVKDLNLDVDVIGVDTVRELDGVALSSRNAYLSPAERKAAVCIPASLNAAKEVFSRGVKESAAIIGEMKKAIEKEPLAKVEYIKVADPGTLKDLDFITKGALVAVAVRIGSTRLIDNTLL